MVHVIPGARFEGGRSGPFFPARYEIRTPFIWRVEGPRGRTGKHLYPAPVIPNNRTCDTIPASRLEPRDHILLWGQSGNTEKLSSVLEACAVVSRQEKPR